jgi:shikimate kinase
VPVRLYWTAMRNIVLFGFMGTGKTVVGKEVARRLGMEFLDMDDVIEEKEGRTISEIFAGKGERHFREVESKVASELAGREGLVIATGGGVVLNEGNVEALQSSGVGICMEARPEVIYGRVKDESHRPLLMTDNPLGEIKGLLRQRGPYYARVRHQIDTSELSVEEAVERVLDIVKNDREGRLSWGAERELV